MALAPTRCRFPVAVLLVLGLPATVAAQVWTPQPNAWSVELVGTHTTRISGRAPGAAVRMVSSTGFVSGLDLDERFDAPCFLQPYGRGYQTYRFDRPEGAAGFTARQWDNCVEGVRRTNDTWESVRVPSPNVVTGLRICRQSSNGRLKGVELRHARLTPSGFDAPGTVRFERTRCNEWESGFVSCPAGQAASGVLLHAEGRSIRGLGLVCSQPVFTVTGWTEPPAATVGAVDMAALLAPRLTVQPAPVTESGLSGTSATRAVLSAGPHTVLERIEVRERGDRPCWIEATFRSHRPATARTTRLLDRCGGTASSGRIVEIADVEGEFRAVAGLAVCQRSGNQRLKGIELFGATVTTQLGVRHDDAITDRARRVNCNDWQPRVSCPSTRIGTSLVVHFRSTPGQPDEVVGFALRCASAQVDLPTFGF